MDLRTLDVFYGLYGEGSNKNFHVFDPSCVQSRGFIITFNDADKVPVDIYPSDFRLNSRQAIDVVMNRRYLFGEIYYREFYALLNAAVLRHRGLLEKITDPTIMNFFSKTMPVMISEAEEELQFPRLGTWAE